MKIAPLAFMLVVSLCVSPLAAQDTLTFASTDHLVTRVSEQVLQEAYARLDMPIEFKRLPAKRALMQSNAGKLDGEVNRIAGIHNKFPNLVQVPTPVHYVRFFAFTKDKRLELSGLDSLRPYTVGILRGIVIADQATQDMKRMVANSHKQLFELLEKRRIDAVLEAYLSTIAAMHSLQVTGITSVGPPLLSTDLYHYVHQKHAHLVPQLTQILSDLTAEGRIEALREQAITELGK